MVSPTSPNTDPTGTQQPEVGLPNSYAAQPDNLGAQGIQPRGERIEGIIQTVIMLAIGAAAGAASFRHVHDVAAAHGQPGWLAWADALILEAASVAAGLELRRRKRHSKPVAFPATTLTCAVVLSLAAQVVEAERSVIGWIAAALPALGFLAMVKMAMGRADTLTSPSRAVPDATTAPGYEPGTVPVEAGPVRPVPGPVRAGADTTRTGRDRRGPPVDLSALLPAARKAAQTLAAHGVTLNRASLAAQLRADGHHLSTANATALVRLLRVEHAAAADLSSADQDTRMTDLPGLSAAYQHGSIRTPAGSARINPPHSAQPPERVPHHDR